MIATIIDLTDQQLVDPAISAELRATAHFDLGVRNGRYRVKAVLANGASVICNLFPVHTPTGGEQIQLGEFTDRLEMRWESLRPTNWIGAKVDFCA